MKVVKDLKRHLEHPEGKHIDQDTPESALMQRLIDALANQIHKNGNESSRKLASGQAAFDDAGIHEAAALLELMENRRAEIQYLEDSALQTIQKVTHLKSCSDSKLMINQIEKLLFLKQQQASIVEAKAALKRADESVKQGRAIMAFTIITMVFVSKKSIN